MEIELGTKKVGTKHPPLVVAELSGNHNGSLERCLQLIHAAKEAGASAIKLQTYRADTITWPSEQSAFSIDDPTSLWSGRNLYDLYKEAALPWEWHATLFALCHQHDLLCFSTPFDETAVDFLEQLPQPPPCYKIASPEIIDLPLLQKVAATGKPVILSTGAASLLEITQAVSCLQMSGCQELILLKCTAAYPALAADIHLQTIPHLAQTFGTLVGLSDHTLGVATAIASVALGACLIEKHLTLNRDEGGVDSAFSLEPAELQRLTTEVLEAWQALGSITYGTLNCEKITHSHRPSLFFIADLPQGHIVQAEDMRTLRPAIGLPPQELQRLVGLPLYCAVQKGTAVSWKHFKVIP